MECADFHCSSGSKDKSNNFSLMGFNKNRVSQEEYPGVHKSCNFHDFAALKNVFT